MHIGSHFFESIDRLKDQSRTVAIAWIAMLTSACASSPLVERAATVSLIPGVAPLAGPVVDVNGESDMAPGRAAMKGLEIAQGCQWALPICAAFTVPAAAIVGATSSATQKLPEEQALELNRVTADISRSVILRTNFNNAMLNEAQRRGIRIAYGNSDALIAIRSTRLWWDISAGNNVAIRMEIDVISALPVRTRNSRSVTYNGTQNSRSVTYKGDSAKVAEWIADDGERIRRALQEAMVGASQLVWEQALGPGD